MVSAYLRNRPCSLSILRTVNISHPRNVSRYASARLPLKPLDPPEFVFGYKYTSSGTPHTHTIQDWEVQAAYSAYLRRYSTRDEALKMLDHEYGTRIPTRHPHFIMGTMKLHPRNFILIGLLRTGLDPDAFDKQGSLF
jgi:hypothetical protein